MANVTPETFKVGDWVVNPQLDEISRDGAVIKLEPRMMRLLLKLSESPGAVLSTPQLLDSVWSGVVVGPASVYQAVSALRKVLGDTDPTPSYVATVTRKGYRLVAPVTPVEPAPPSPARESVPDPASRSARSRPWWIALPAAALVLAGVWYAWPPASAPRATVKVPSPSRSIASLPRVAIPDLLQSPVDDEARTFAIAVSELLRTRLLSQPELVLLQNISSFGLQLGGQEFLEASRRIRAQYVLKGTARRSEDKVQIAVELVKIDNGQSLWKLSYDRPFSDMTEIREQIVSRIAQSLQVTLRDTGNTPVDLDQQLLYMQALLTKFSDAPPATAQAMFNRATVLYPQCARCYLGLGESLEDQRLPADSYQLRLDAASKAFDRAIELDPESAEALYRKAMHVEDEAVAEQMFRRAIQLAPNDEYAYMQYARFLEINKRTGEAIDMYNRSLQLDPVSMAPLLAMARIAIFTHGDVEQFERLLRQSIADCPGCGASTWLARSRLVFSGASADAVKILEQMPDINQEDFEAKPMLVAAYLDVDDPDAASAVAGNNALAQLQIAQYRHIRQRPSKLPEGLKRISFPGGPGAGISPLAEALRDEAMETHQYAVALSSLDTIFKSFTFPAPGGCKVSLVSAHVLLLSGKKSEAEAQARDILTMLDSEAVGRPPHWFARERAMAHMLLGDHEHAIAELQESQKRNNFVRWWYTGELDPLFAPLHSDPRFQLLVAAARKHRVEQRALVDEMRRKGEVPMRKL